MHYVIAVLGLSAACVVWYLVQRAAGVAGEAECDEDEARCDECARRTDRCPGARPGAEGRAEGRRTRRS